MNALYNEIDPFAASWLDNLIAAGHIAPGRVERRSIAELKPADVAGPGQRHFFSGIGGWSYALRLAGVPDDADVWTGSCPCQPFSSAGKRGGTSDPRHLWPTWFALIRECRPPTIFGEQVAGPDGFAWLDGVFADLEGCGYACGAAVVSAGGISAPHGRHRLYFVANAAGARLDRTATWEERGGQRRTWTDSILGNADCLSSWQQRGAVPRTHAKNEDVRSGADGSRASGQLLDPWLDHRWIDCADGKRRPIPIEPALFPLAHGVPNRVGLLRGSGNAIVPQLAAVFIEAAFAARGR